MCHISAKYLHMTFSSFYIAYKSGVDWNVAEGNLNKFSLKRANNITKVLCELTTMKSSFNSSASASCTHLSFLNQWCIQCVRMVQLRIVLLDKAWMLSVVLELACEQLLINHANCVNLDTMILMECREFVCEILVQLIVLLPEVAAFEQQRLHTICCVCHLGQVYNGKILINR